MSGNQDKNPEGQGAENPQDKKRLPDAVFSPEETISLVKGFVLAYMRGQLEVSLPSSQDLVNEARTMGKNKTLAEAEKEEISALEDIENACAICLGTIPSTQEERQTAVDFIAQLIIRLRSTTRLKGTFMEVRIEEKLAQLEREQDAINALLERFIDWFRQGGALP